MTDERKKTATHEAWLDLKRPAARRIVRDVWREPIRIAVLSAISRRHAAGIKRFVAFRAAMCDDLINDVQTIAQANATIAASDYRNELYLASSRDGAVDFLAGLMVHSNAEIDSVYRDVVLFLDAWRE